CQHYSNWPTF
nr:immunoglobulin light chain junction region [Macaca mulatta]